MKEIMKNKQLWTFIGGVVAALAGTKLVKSEKARELAVKGLANGMKLRDDATAAYETICEDAKDLCSEAKARNESQE